MRTTVWIFLLSPFLAVAIDYPRMPESLTGPQFKIHMDSPTNHAQRMVFGRELRGYFVYVREQIREPSPRDMEWLKREDGRVMAITNEVKRMDEGLALRRTKEWKAAWTRDVLNRTINKIDWILSKGYLRDESVGTDFVTVFTTPDKDESEMVAWLSLCDTVMVSEPIGSLVTMLAAEDRPHFFLDAGPDSGIVAIDKLVCLKVMGIVSRYLSAQAPKSLQWWPVLKKPPP